MISHHIVRRCQLRSRVNTDILFQEVAVDSVVPLPPEDVLANEKYQAIPSPIFPSDHLALVANMKFRQ